MPQIGNIELNLHTTDRDQTVYARQAQTLSHVDNVALNRQLPKASSNPLRTQMRFERGFAVGTEGLEKSATVSVAVTAPVGADPAAVAAYVTECLTQGAVASGTLAVSGDIHL